MHPRAAFFLALFTAAAHAGPRISVNYTVVTDTTDAGGKRATSASYSHDGTAGGIAGIARVAAPAQTAKHGYIGQLYEVTALQLAAAPATVIEGATRQLGALELLDDASTIAVAASSIAWSVQSGPLASIDGSGLATAGTVYQDTPATAQGVYAGNTGTLNLTVVDILPDNFGSYAADGLADSWQNLYFGLNNPHAAPGYVSDGSGLTNLFKYTAGLIPNDPASRFLLEVQPVTGQPAQKNIVFNPSLTDRTYTIEFSTGLAGWNTLTGPFTGNGSTQTVLDAGAGSPQKFYRVQVSKP